VGFRHFRTLFQSESFYRILRNTVILGFGVVFLTFPVPLFFAVMINEVRQMFLRRVSQTLLYIPHFFSWVIISGFVFEFLGTAGPVNMIRSWLGMEPVLYMQQAGAFRPIIILASIFRDTGWGTIIFLAAISGIDPQLYEASSIDGASSLQKIRYVTVPSILPTATILLLLRIGNFMNLGFDRIWVFLTPMTYRVGDIFDTYVFRVGITQGEYSITTAIGMFQSVIGLILIVTANHLARKVSEGLW
jgi:putative aldouronate transport system permease protein